MSRVKFVVMLVLAAIAYGRDLKTVAFTARDVDAQAVLRYRPGAPH